MRAWRPPRRLVPKWLPTDGVYEAQRLLAQVDGVRRAQSRVMAAAFGRYAWEQPADRSAQRLLEAVEGDVGRALDLVSELAAEAA